MNNKNKIELILRHMRRVEENCYIIATKLIDTSPTFALALVHRGRLHDASKLVGFEFEHLWSGDNQFKEALIEHRANNSHHPEYYDGGVCDMSELDIAEMVADCTARSAEFGTDIRSWFAKPVYDCKRERIEYYLSLLLHAPFVYPSLK